jgi:hypothetical protein
MFYAQQAHFGVHIVISESFEHVLDEGLSAITFALIS